MTCKTTSETTSKGIYFNVVRGKGKGGDTRRCFAMTSVPEWIGGVEKNWDLLSVFFSDRFFFLCGCMSASVAGVYLFYFWFIEIPFFFCISKERSLHPADLFEKRRLHFYLFFPMPAEKQKIFYSKKEETTLMEQNSIFENIIVIIFSPPVSASAETSAFFNLPFFIPLVLEKPIFFFFKFLRSLL